MTGLTQGNAEKPCCRSRVQPACPSQLYVNAPGLPLHISEGTLCHRMRCMVRWFTAGRVKDALGIAWQLCVHLYDELLRTRAFDMGAAVAFYTLLSLIPLLFVLSALLGSLPIPNLFGELLSAMAVLVPPDAMKLVQTIIASIFNTNHVKLLSFGLLSYIWAASGGFSALIDALNVAYDVKVLRPWWRDRLQALLLTFTSGALAGIGMGALLAGPWLGAILRRVLPMPHSVYLLWPLVRLSTMFIAFVAALEIIYLLGPNRKERVRDTLPGATVAVAVWFAGSGCLSFYLDHMANYDATYGSLGAVIGLMLWLYLSAIAVLAGAELNAEIEKWRARQHGGAAPERAAQRSAA